MMMMMIVSMERYWAGIGKTLQRLAVNHTGATLPINTL
jgi:hypothetical protein